MIPYIEIIEPPTHKVMRVRTSAQVLLNSKTISKFDVSTPTLLYLVFAAVCDGQKVKNSFFCSFSCFQARILH